MIFDIIFWWIALAALAWLVLLVIIRAGEE